MKLHHIYLLVNPKQQKLLKDMEQKGVIAIEGKGKGTKYRIK